MTRVEFTVPGTPQQRGSKIATARVNKRTGQPYRDRFGRIIVNMFDSNEKESKKWMKVVAKVARSAFNGELLEGPIRLNVTFYFARPKSHYGTGRNANKLKPSAPATWHAQSPDLAKLVRCLEDAINDVVWKDDRYVCHYGDVRRAWTTGEPRAEVMIETISEDSQMELL